ncbi:MAG: radical SAM protein [Nitrospinales bacterium]
MKITEVRCRSILTRAGGYLKPVVSHSLNPYVGCGFGRSACGVACYVRHNPWLSRGRVWGEFVDVKTNAAEVYLRTCGVEKSWAHKRSRPFAIFFSSSTDPWQPLEQTYRITRGLLQAMRERPPDRLILQTHGTAVREDFSLIAELARQCDLAVHVSVEGDRERLPGLPPPPCSLASRLHLLSELAAAGINAVACLSPLYPMKNPEAFFASLAKTGIRGVVIDHFIRGDGTPDGARTRQTALPAAMAAVDAESTQLDYRDKIARIAVRYLPVGISSSGFAGNFAAPGSRPSPTFLP